MYSRKLYISTSVHIMTTERSVHVHLIKRFRKIVYDLRRNSTQHEWLQDSANSSAHWAPLISSSKIAYMQNSSFLSRTTNSMFFNCWHIIERLMQIVEDLDNESAWLNVHENFVTCVQALMKTQNLFLLRSRRLWVSLACIIVGDKAPLTLASVHEVLNVHSRYVFTWCITQATKRYCTGDTFVSHVVYNDFKLSMIVMCGACVIAGDGAPFAMRLFAHWMMMISQSHHSFNVVATWVHIVALFCTCVNMRTRKFEIVCTVVAQMSK
jgi:hypothetical protein